MTFSIDSDKVETNNALINIDSNSHTQFKDKRGNALIEFATDINFKDTAGNFHDIGVKNMYMDEIGGTMVDHVNATDAHHIKYTDSEAVDAVNSTTESLTAPLYSHKTDISSSVTIPGGFATVVSSPITGSASISGDGRISSVGNSSVSSSDYSPETEPFSSHLISTQTNAENGFNVNIFESVDISNTSITKDLSSQITFNTSGVYSISWMVNFHRTGSGGRNIMYSEIELNNKNLSSRSRVADYIRTDGNGDECSTGNTVLLSLSSGDTIGIYANEERGGESGNDIERAFINITKVK